MGTLNPSFETPGATFGQADSWTESYDTGAEDVAPFRRSDGNVQPWEDFEDSWMDNHYYQVAFTISDLVAAFFNGLAQEHEPFESGWKLPGSSPDIDNSAAVFVFVADNFKAAVFTTTLLEYDGFEAAWGYSPYNQSSITDFGAGAFIAASFDAAVPEDVEDFEEEWQSNENYDTGFVVNGADPNLTAAMFDAGLNAYENFAGAWTLTLP